MIQHVRIQNYKSLRDVHIDLERFTVFVGANGSGKTSVLEAINFCVQASTGKGLSSFKRIVRSKSIYTRGETGNLVIQCRTRGGEFELEATPPDGFSPDDHKTPSNQWIVRTLPKELPAYKTALEPATSTTYLRLNASELARASYLDDDLPKMMSNGFGLASVLAYMALNDPQGFEELTEFARQLIPRLRRIRFRKAPVYTMEKELVRFGSDTVERTSNRKYQGEVILLDFEHAEDIPSHNASEGTMLILGFLAILLGPTRPRILLFDDLEQGLHPLAQKRMFEVICTMLQKFPDLQIIATAHSPYLLNFIPPEQVRIMAQGPDGHSVCGKLTDHPQFERWKDEMAPGEMWSVFGEKWLTEIGAAS